MMRSWRNSRCSALLGVMVLIAPTPAISGKSIMVANCGGSAPQRIDIPADPGTPSEQECCRKGCHAGSDRRKKMGSAFSDCC
jgi:hypothetical protein